MINYKIKQFIDNSLEDADGRISVTSRARYESQEITDSYREWMDIIVNFFISDPQAFISLQPTSINLTNDLFPLYINEAKIENALEMQNELLSEAKAEVEEMVKASTIPVNEIKYNTLDREDVIKQLKDKLTRVVSYYDNGFLTFAIVVPFDYADMEIKDFRVFEDWARKKLNLSDDYHLLTADVVESTEKDEIEYVGGLPWYRAKTLKSPEKKPLSDSELKYINRMKAVAEKISKVANSNYVLMENLPLYSPREKAAFYGVEKEYDIIKSFRDSCDKYDTVIDGLYLYVKKNYSGHIFIDKTLLDDKIGLFIGKQGRNIKELSQRVGRKIILK